jgi:dTDP-4-amino-4,6-dideoxygalactose transaminase
MIPLFKVFMPETVMDPLRETLFSGYIGQGKQVDKFERRLSRYFDNKPVVTVNSGTSGLHLALKLLNVGPDDEVLSTPLTCSATNFPILLSGAHIRWCDIDPHDLNIDPEDVAKKITSRTKAIIVVHWGGYPCDLDRLREVAGDIPIIEDCAHAFGSFYKGRRIGTSDNYCMFSFQAIKTFNTVDGGCLIVPQDKYKRAKLLRWYGIDRESEPEERHELQCGLNISEAGTKWHMNDINASIGLEQLKYIDDNLNIQVENGKFYNENLKGVHGLTLIQQDSSRLSSYWLYTIKVERMHDFHKHMTKNGIAVSQVHARNDRHTCTIRSRTSLPNLDEVADKYISIPVGWWVSQKDRQYIAETIRRGW